MTPAAGVLISRLGSSAFTETDGVSAAFALTGVGLATTFVTPYALASVSKSFTDGKGFTISPEAEIGYRHDEAAQGGAFTLTAADGTVFTATASASPRAPRSSASGSPPAATAGRPTSSTAAKRPANGPTRAPWWG